jgi:hypothetical protein
MASMSNRIQETRGFYKIYTDSDDVGSRDAEQRSFDMQKPAKRWTNCMYGQKPVLRCIHVQERTEPQEIVDSSTFKWNTVSWNHLCLMALQEGSGRGREERKASKRTGDACVVSLR